MRYLSAILLLLFDFASDAQGRYDVWYFGNGVGLDFNISPPQQLLNGALNASEGTSAICDSNGLLKYYSDGNKIWNANHEVIANGDSLIWDNTSSQGSLIIKQPGKTNTYFVFGAVGTEHAAENLTNLKRAGMFYSIISKDSVVRKNVQLHNSRTERLTAYYQDEGDFYWIATTYGSTSYEDSSAIYLYKLTKDGISLHRKYNIAYSGIRGQMKFSPNGKLLALASEYSSKRFPPSPGKVQLFDFDSNNGFLSNPRCISGIRSHGLEFSPNSNLLYFTAFGANLGLFQVKVEEIAHTDFQNTQTVRLSDYSSLFVLQLAPDGKIYCNRSDSSLALIEKPNVYGPGCAFKLRALNYPTILLWGAVRISRLNLSLPQCVQNLIIQPKLLTQDACLREKVSFKIMSSFADSIQWDFGDGHSIASSSDTVFYSYLNAGAFQVKAILYYPNHSDTLIDTVRIYELPTLNLGNDTLLFSDESLEISLNEFNGNQIIWDDGSGSVSRLITEAGFYSVEVTDGYCLARDSIRIEYMHRKLSVDSLCYQDSTTFRLIDPLIDSVYWIVENRSFSSSAASWFRYVFKSYGDQKIRIKALKNGLKRSWEDSIQITYIEKDFLEELYTFCSGDSASLEPQLNDNSYSYRWNTGSTEPVLKIDTSGIYILEIVKKSCIAHDSAQVIMQDCNCHYHIPSAFSPNGDGLNETFTVHSECGLKEVRLNIYNRWGEQLINSEQQWDGTYMGQHVASGVYFYTAEIIALDHSVSYRSGSIHLIR